MELATDKKIEIILIAGIAILTVILVVGVFAYRNYDILNENFPEVKGYKFGFTEDIVKLKDGTEIYYLEGPDNGPKLLLLHGQQSTCYDYAKMLLKLSKEFHVYVVDYYGQEVLSENSVEYNTVEIGNEIIWFIENIIKDKVYISSHSSREIIADYVSSKAPDYIIATVLENGPFFYTLSRSEEKKNFMVEN